MASVYKTKLDLLRNDVLIKTHVITASLTKVPSTLAIKRRTNLHLEQMQRMVQDFKEMTATYISKLPKDNKDLERSHLTAHIANYEVSLRDLNQQFQDLIHGDEEFCTSQFPIGSARYKSFAIRITRKREEIQKLIEDMRKEAEDEPDSRRIHLYRDSIARHWRALDKDIPALIPLITTTHGALNEKELDNLYGYSYVLSPPIQEASATFANLTLPASARHPTSTRSLSHNLGANSSPHQSLPESVTLLSPRVPTTAVAPSQDQQDLFMPYRQRDYPHFPGVAEELGAWRHEWAKNMVPWLSEEVTLWEMTRCTPAALDLSTCDTMDNVLRDLDRPYGNPVTSTLPIMHHLLGRRPSDIPGTTEETRLVNLEGTLQRPNRHLGEVNETHQLQESTTAVKHTAKLMPPSFSRVWAASPQATQAPSLSAGPAERRDLLNRHIEALSTFIRTTVDSTYTQSPWMLLPPSPERSNGRQTARGSKINAFSSTREGDREGYSEDHPSNVARQGRKQKDAGQNVRPLNLFQRKSCHLAIMNPAGDYCGEVENTPRVIPNTQRIHLGAGITISLRLTHVQLEARACLNQSKKLQPQNDPNDERNPASPHHDFCTHDIGTSFIFAGIALL